MHDALYELFDAYPPVEEASLRLWHERLADYYRLEQAQAADDKSVREQATINLLYYELQRDPRHAFEAGYVRWDEMAIKGYEVGLDMRLRDELLRFFRSPVNQQRATTQGLTPAVIDRDSAVRWVKRFLIRARHQQAIAVAETILVFGPPPYASLVPNATARVAVVPAEQQAQARALFNLADPLYWGHVLTYYGEALTYTGAPEVQIRHIFDQAIALLDTVSLDREKPLGWLRERVLGRAYTMRGYLLRTYGHYGEALGSYRRALPHFETALVTDEQANTLNNLAFLLALLGDLEKAKVHVDQGLTLHQGLGQQYPLAISHNTRGLVYALQGHPDAGVRECQMALNIFEELEAPRGIGLACNALGFVLRQQGERWKTRDCTQDQAIGFFREAAGFLERAAEVFSTFVAEPLRLWEAYNERGSLYCDWGDLLRHRGDEIAAQQQYEQALAYHLRALEVAERHGLRFQEADTCDDLAQVWAGLGNMEKAKQWLKQGLSLVPAEYTLIAGQGFRNAPEPGEAYWLVLGKAYCQQGIWALRCVEQGGLANEEGREQTRQGIEYFALASAYFQRYWPGTEMLSSRLHSMAHELDKAGISVDYSNDLINQLASSYEVDFSAFLDVIGTTPA